MSTLFYITLFVATLFSSSHVTVNAQAGIQWLPLVDDPSNVGGFLTKFVCVYRDPANGYGTVFLGGGTFAYNINVPDSPKYITFDDYQTGYINPTTIVRRSWNTPGTHWIYLTDALTGNNVDYLQVEIVTLGVYTGNCADLQVVDETGNPLPPDGWTSGSPPAYTPSSN